ncbi:hypothetical protein [Streptomyces nanshensis]|uniref:Uncharacterized protein n=1 Tax=Streptomyces nanshensis TaxID=518642 RepID=A0A1E7L887_9ACTN|nr:hypothetical protein [Streptomyces nanshensis]OEV12442.1 hypothetical protein AN218_08215 [Streptomyces nanshensis]
MTAHSGRGQGEQPLYEGVVLPANGDPWTPEQQRQVDRPHGQPLAGQPWGDPWGPGSQAAVTSGEAAPSLPPPPEVSPAGHVQPEQQHLIPHQQQSSSGETGAGDAYAGGRPGEFPYASPTSSGFPSADLPPAGPVPSELHGGQNFYTGGPQPQQQHYPGPPPQQPPAAPPFTHGAGMPQPYGHGQTHGQPHGQTPGQDASAPVGASLAASPSGPAASQAPMSSPSDATQYIPPVTGDGPPPGSYQQGHAQPMADADATQMLPPQNGQPPAQDPESTRQLRTPLPPEASGQGQNGNDGQPRPSQPPAGFESLFRAEPSAGSGDSGEPGSTQSLPLFDQASARQRSVGGLGNSQGGPGSPGAPGGAYGQGHGVGPGDPQPAPWEPQGRAARRNAERGAFARISPGVLIAVGVAVVAGVGMAAGAALTGGDDDAKGKSKSSAAPADKKSAAADPAKAQAVELDKLLGDSNNSRASVINSVENIKRCKKLGQAAQDLRSAAGQRNSLVSRLGKLKTDHLPEEAQLRSALARAWKASAAADNHYAAWADQTAGKKGCHKGKARTTPHVGQGARSSGEATAAKKQAAGLWNPTARKYGLKQRQVGQL